MIPRRITLKGFLCYKDEQVIDLDGRDLWVFSGRNGSGKSAIFDAMTFALFGAHRGGAKDIRPLIHFNSDEFRIVFEFDLGPERYRIRRSTPRRGASERQVFRHAPQETEAWPPVPETHTDDGFDRWVQEHIGVSYETFTASVLLLQGRAENLVDAKPRARYEILAGILDLARYQRLHERADGHRKRWSHRLDDLRKQWEAQAVVTDEDLERAEGELAAANEARAAADSEWQRLVGIEAQAREWCGLAAQRRRTEEAIEHVERLLADAEAIRRDAARLRELDRELPILAAALGLAREWAAKVEDSARLESEIAAAARKLDHMDALRMDERAHHAEIVAEIGRDQGRREAIADRLAALAAPVQRFAQGRACRETIDKLGAELAAFPPDLEARAEGLRADFDRAHAWKAALPTLKRLADDRRDLAGARRHREEAHAATIAAQGEVLRCAEEARGRRADESAARDESDEASRRRTEAATVLHTAQADFDNLASLDGEPNCDRCGQPLTPAHLDAESARRREAADRARHDLARVAEHHDTRRKALADARAAREQADEQLRRAEESLMHSRTAAEQAARDADRLAKSWLESFDQLDEPFRDLIAPDIPDDPLAAAEIPEAEFAEGQARAAAIPSLKERLDAITARLADRRDLSARLEQSRDGLRSIGLRPGDDLAQAEHDSLSTERAALDRCLKGHETARGLVEETLRYLDDQIETERRARAEADKALATVRTRAAGLAEELDRLRDSAAVAWRSALGSATDADLATWEAERAALRASEIEARAAELPTSAGRLDAAQAELAGIDGRLAVIPAEARRPPETIAAHKDAADRGRDGAEARRRDRQTHRDGLIHARDSRRELEALKLDAEAHLAVATTLATYLGRDGLQRQLVRRAERGILDHANPILREISGGDLEMRFASGADDEPGEKALDLEVLVRTHGQTFAIGLGYLSGSQKFRAAVSLALAIGRYARGSRSRPIDSVIIDEGFGSLDRQGRDEMIAQLAALKGRLGRIVLVSHQEEIADAFADGYYFEIRDGSTVAEPFHR